MLAFYVWIAAQIPYTHDDWDWGLEVGMQHLLKADINSRYVGNLIEVICGMINIFETNKKQKNYGKDFDYKSIK